MGQRSQIYIRTTNDKGEMMLIAKYYQWNFGERMISRARHTIEQIYNYGIEHTDFCWQQLAKIIDVNFDMHDIASSSNLIEEWLRDDMGYYASKEDFSAIVFNADNNDGKLFIDIDQKTKTIKYCFTDYDNKIIKSPLAYMNWDCENWQKSEYLSADAKKTCRKNIKYLNENATYMTNEELRDFLDYDYTGLFKEQRDFFYKLRWNLTLK